MHVLDDRVASGRNSGLWWFWCESCGFAHDMIGVAGRVWKTNPRQTLERLNESGYEFPASRINQYLSQVVKPTNALEGLWRQAIEAYDREPIVARIDSRSLLEPMKVLEYQNAKRIEKLTEKNNRISILPIRDQPGRLSGFVILDSKGSVAGTIHRPDLPPKNLGIVVQNDWLGGAEDQSILAIPDIPAASLIADSLSSHANARIVLWGPWTGEAGWSIVKPKGRIYVGETAMSPRGLSLMVSLGARAVRCPASMNSWREKLSASVDMALVEMMDNSRSWSAVLASVLEKLPKLQVQQTLQKLVGLGVSIDKLRAASDSRLSKVLDRSDVTPVKAPASRAMIEPAKTLVETDNGIYLRSPNGDELQISDAVVQVQRVIRLTLRGQTWCEGVIKFKGREVPFFEPESALTARWLRERLMDQGLGIPVILDRWSRRLVEISERLHDPELIRVRDDVGWDDSTGALVLPGYSIFRGGEVKDHPVPDFPGIPMTGGLGVSRPKNPTRAELIAMQPPASAAVTLLPMAAVASVLLARVTRKRTRPLYLYGDAATQAAELLAKPLGCPVVRIKSARDTKKLEELAERSTGPEAAWPSFLICHPDLLRHAKVVEWLKPGHETRFAVINRETALAAAAFGTASVQEISSIPRNFMDAIRSLGILFPSYLQNCMRKCGVVDDRGKAVNSQSPSRRVDSFLKAVIDDAYEYLSDKLGRLERTTRVQGYGRIHTLSPRGLILAGEYQRADDIANLIAHWAIERRVKTMPRGFEDGLAQLVYCLESDRLVIPRAAFAALMDGYPVQYREEQVTAAFERDNRLVEATASAWVVKYSWWREKMLEVSGVRDLENPVKTDLVEIAQPVEAS